MGPAFARRTPQQQPLTASGRPKRSTTLKKEALKEEEDEAKSKALKEKDAKDAKDDKEKEKKPEVKKGNQSKSRGPSRRSKSEESKSEESKSESEKDDEKSTTDASSEKCEETTTDEISEEEPAKKPLAKRGGPKKEDETVVDGTKVKAVEEVMTTSDDSQVETEEEKEEVKGEEKKGEEKKGEEKKGEEKKGEEIVEESESDLDAGEEDDDEDKDFDPDDDPEKLWCFCKKPHGNRFMICCDSCEDWFHGDCIGITMEKGREMEKTGEEWCCNSCKEKKGKSATKKDNSKKDFPSVTSPLNTPLGGRQKTLDPIPITKAKNISLDNLKANLAKSLKNGEKVKAPQTTPSSDTKSAEPVKPGNVQIKTEITTPEKVTPTKDKEASKLKRRESTGKQEFKDLLTFDQIPIKRDDVSKKKSSHHEASTERRHHDRRDSQSSEDDSRKRKKEEIKKNPPTKVRSHSQSKPAEPPKMCVRSECNRAVMKGAIYCSRECIYKYANENLKYIEEEKKKNKEIGKSPDLKQESAKGTVICPATSSTDRVSDTTQERIAVFEKSSGKVVAGVMAPTKKYLFAWLEEHPTYEVLKPGKQPSDIKSSNKQDEVIRSNVRKSLRDILVLRCKETEMAINAEAVGKLSKKIESELLKMFNNETGQKYKTKYRSLIFNLKDRQNKILYKRVVSGEISPRKLVQMSPEQLATPELAQWRQQQDKHHLEMVKKREQDDAEIKKTPALKKTHKGEVVIEDEKVSYETLLELKSEPIVDRKPKSASSDADNLVKDTTEEHTLHLFDSNCKICTGKMAPPGESQVTGVSTTIIQAIPESSGMPDMPSPQQFDEIESYLSSSPPSPDTSSITSPIMSPEPGPGPRNLPNVKKQPSVWRGFINMQKVAKFVCTAYAVSGSCESLMDVLPDSIHVCGRIPPSQVWDYLGLLREGRKSHYKYLDVIRFEMSTDEEKSGYIKLYTYFYTRQRIGVIGNCYAGIKDIYILPLASHDPIPTELRPLPGLPKPRPHMLLGIIVRVKSDKPKLPKEIVDSSPEMIIPTKKKKRKKDKKKEKEAAKEEEKEKSDRDLERERAEITLERERVELEAQKKLIDIIFKNRATDGLAPLTPDHLLQASMTGNVPALVPNNQSPQSMELPKPPGFPSELINITEPSKVEPMDNNLSAQRKHLEEQQIEQIKIQREEIMKLQSNGGSISNQDEMVMIPDPESIAKDIRENVLNQMSEAMQEVSEVPTDHTAAVAGILSMINAGGQRFDSSSNDNVKGEKVDANPINTNLDQPLQTEEKDSLFQAWLERPTKVNPLPTEQLPSIVVPEHRSPNNENGMYSSELPVHISVHDLSPRSETQTSSAFASPTPGVDQAHVQNLFASISSSIAHVQSMVVTDPHEITPPNDGLTIQSDFEPITSTSSDLHDDAPLTIEETNQYPGNQDIDKHVLQDIEQRFKPVTSSSLPEEEERIPGLDGETGICDISPCSSPPDDNSSSPPRLNIPGVVDISPPSTSRSPSPPHPKGNNIIPLVGMDTDNNKSDDEFALDLIEDIKVPTHIPRRATLFSLDLIKMRAGVKMPELPDIKLPEKSEKSKSVALPPPPIPAGIPTVPIPPDIELPPGVPFPPLPPAPPPASESNSGGVIPVDVAPVEDIRSGWTSSAPLSVPSTNGVRPPLSMPVSTLNLPRFMNPPPPTIIGSASDPIGKSLLPMGPGQDIRAPLGKSLFPIRPGQDIRPPLGEGQVYGPVPMFAEPGLHQGMRMPPVRPGEPPLGNRFRPPMPPGPQPLPPGPQPQRPNIGNPFPRPILPPGGMQGRYPPPAEHRFPVEPSSIHRPMGRGGFRSPIKNPALRGVEPRNFDIRGSGPRFDHDRGREAAFRPPLHRPPLFDIPRPRRPLAANLELDRPERLPPPFEQEIQRPPLQRPPFQPEIRPHLEPGRQRPPFEPEPYRPPFKSEHSANSRVRDDRGPPPHRDYDGRPFREEMPYYEEYEDGRRDRRHDRPDFDRSDSGYSRNNRDKCYPVKNRQKFNKHGRHGSSSYDERRESERPPTEFGRYRPPKNDDIRESRERFDSHKKFDDHDDDGPSKAKQPRANKYTPLATTTTTTSTELEELEEGEVL